MPICILSRVASTSLSAAACATNSPSQPSSDTLPAGSPASEAKLPSGVGQPLAACPPHVPLPLVASAARGASAALRASPNPAAARAADVSCLHTATPFRRAICDARRRPSALVALASSWDLSSCACPLRRERDPMHSWVSGASPHAPRRIIIAKGSLRAEAHAAAERTSLVFVWTDFSCSSSERISRLR